MSSSILFQERFNQILNITVTLSCEQYLNERGRAKVALHTTQEEMKHVLPTQHKIPIGRNRIMK